MAMTLITTNTSSGAASSSFTSSIDSTYKLYVFKFYDVNPATDATNFDVQFNAVGGSEFNETITSTFFRAYQDEGGTATSLHYDTTYDKAQGTGYQNLANILGNGAGESCAGELFLFNPSNTTYVKHFYSRLQVTESSRADDAFVAGYINDTTAIDDILNWISSIAVVVFI